MNLFSEIQDIVTTNTTENW